MASLLRCCRLYGLLIVVIVGCWCVAGVDLTGKKREGDGLLQRVMDSVELGLNFFAEDFASINVDGLFGMRLGQGQIIQALQECRSSSTCPEDFKRRLQKVKDGVDRTASAAMEYVKEQDPDYFERFTQTINNPYILRYTPQMLTDLDKTPAGSDENYDEESGDRCFARIMGTYEEHGKKVEPCNVTRHCWDMMTKADRARYSVTHQQLYFIMVEKTNCVEEVERSVGKHIDGIEARLCGSIYNEAFGEIKDGDVEEMTQDLFLEQTLLCGSLGFENFMRAEWIQMVLRWQTSTGCFWIKNPAFRYLEKQMSLFDDEKRKLLNELKQEARKIEKHHHQSRNLLREHMMSDGCLSHKSGLGFGTLSLYLRYLIRQTFLHP